MQFAGQRTSLDLEPIGEPVNRLVKMTDDCLPNPEAIMVTGITPQQTREDGYEEAEFAKFLNEAVFTQDTIVVGFNSIRFDDEFIRYFLWRNFYDPYEWAWRDGRSRWDMLDIVRMTRALRPEGITWPVNDGVATNRLELLTKANNLDHFKAHDALSDVEALIAVTRLIKEKQSSLYSYLFNMRDKKLVQKLVNLDDKKPFVYTSGRYEAEFNKTTVAFPLTSGKNGNVVVYDLRYDPKPLLNMSVKELKNKLYATREERMAPDFVKLPVKEMQYNRAPAVAPLGVLSQGNGWDKISLDEDTIAKNQRILLSSPAFAENIRTIFEGREEFKKSSDPEAQLYDSFVPDIDKVRIEAVRNADERILADFHPEFVDERLDSLLLHYKARNFPSSLSQDEAISWEKWRLSKVNARLKSYGESLYKLSTEITDDRKSFALQELQLWAESIIPSE